MGCELAVHAHDLGVVKLCLEFSICYDSVKNCAFKVYICKSISILCL